MFDSNTKFVSIGTLNEDKIAFISDIDSDIAKNFVLAVIFYFGKTVSNTQNAIKMIFYQILCLILVLKIFQVL